MSTRAAPRPTGAYGPREGVRPRPGAGQSQHLFFFKKYNVCAVLSAVLSAVCCLLSVLCVLSSGHKTVGPAAALRSHHPVADQTELPLIHCRDHVDMTNL